MEESKKINPRIVRRMEEEGHTIAEIARKLGCERMTVYRALSDTAKPPNPNTPPVVPPHSPPPLDRE